MQQGRAGLMNEFMNINEGFICINPSFQGVKTDKCEGFYLHNL